MKARSVNEMRVADKGIYIDEEYMDDVLTAIIHGNMGFFGGVGEEGQVRDSFEEKILDDPELSRIFSGAVKRHVPARMAAKKLWSIMVKKGMDDYGDLMEGFQGDGDERDGMSGFRGDFKGDTPADQGMRAARAEQYDNSEYVLLKIRNMGYRKPEIKVLAIGTKEEMENMKVEVDATRKKYGGGYELSVHRVG